VVVPYSMYAWAGTSVLKLISAEVSQETTTLIPPMLGAAEARGKGTKHTAKPITTSNDRLRTGINLDRTVDSFVQRRLRIERYLSELVSIAFTSINNAVIIGIVMCRFVAELQLIDDIDPSKRITNGTGLESG